MCKFLTSFYADTLKSLDEDKRVNPRARQLEKILAKKLSEYLSCEVCYAIRRVMAAEQNRLYRGPDRGKLLSLNHSRKAPCIIFIFHALLNLGSVINKANKQTKPASTQTTIIYEIDMHYLILRYYLLYAYHSYTLVFSIPS